MECVKQGEKVPFAGFIAVCCSTLKNVTQQKPAEPILAVPNEVAEEKAPEVPKKRKRGDSSSDDEVKKPKAKRGSSCFLIVVTIIAKRGKDSSSSSSEEEKKKKKKEEKKPEEKKPEEKKPEEKKVVAQDAGIFSYKCFVQMDTDLPPPLITIEEGGQWMGSCVYATTKEHFPFNFFPENVCFTSLIGNQQLAGIQWEN